MDAPEQVRVFAQEVPLPPAYSESDPQPKATKSFARSSKTHTSNSDDVSSSGVFVTTSSRMAGAYDNMAFVPVVERQVSVESDPPLYELEAPPPYKE